MALRRRVPSKSAVRNHSSPRSLAVSESPPIVERQEQLHKDGWQSTASPDMMSAIRFAHDVGSVVPALALSIRTKPWKLRAAYWPRTYTGNTSGIGPEHQCPVESAHFRPSLL